LAVPERLANRPEQGFGKVAIWPKVVKYIAGRYVGFWTEVLTGRAKRELSPNGTTVSVTRWLHGNNQLRKSRCA
jgi:hypothetical protein